MTKEEFAEATTKLISENEIQVNDAMHVLIAHAVTLAIMTRPLDEARKRLHEFVDQVVDDASRALG